VHANHVGSNLTDANSAQRQFAFPELVSAACMSHKRGCCEEQEGRDRWNHDA
jgi:hypothetical protein